MEYFSWRGWVGGTALSFMHTVFGETAEEFFNRAGIICSYLSRNVWRILEVAHYFKLWKLGEKEICLFSPLSPPLLRLSPFSRSFWSDILGRVVSEFFFPLFDLWFVDFENSHLHQLPISCLIFNCSRLILIFSSVLLLVYNLEGGGWNSSSYSYWSTFFECFEYYSNDCLQWLYLLDFLPGLWVGKTMKALYIGLVFISYMKFMGSCLLFVSGFDQELLFHLYCYLCCRWKNWDGKDLPG